MPLYISLRQVSEFEDFRLKQAMQKTRCDCKLVCRQSMGMDWDNTLLLNIPKDLMFEKCKEFSWNKCSPPQLEVSLEVAASLTSHAFNPTIRCSAIFRRDQTSTATIALSRILQFYMMWSAKIKLTYRDIKDDRSIRCETWKARCRSVCKAQTYEKKLRKQTWPFGEPFTCDRDCWWECQQGMDTELIKWTHHVHRMRSKFTQAAPPTPIGYSKRWDHGKPLDDPVPTLAAVNLDIHTFTVTMLVSSKEAFQMNCCKVYKTKSIPAALLPVFPQETEKRSVFHVFATVQLHF